MLSWFSKVITNFGSRNVAPISVYCVDNGLEFDFVLEKNVLLDLFIINLFGKYNSQSLS